MTENKRFELKLCSNGTYYVYENGTLTDIDFDKFNKESADALIDEVNDLYEENEQLIREKERYKTLHRIANEQIDNRILTIKNFVEECSDDKVKRALEKLLCTEVQAYDVSAKNKALVDENKYLKKEYLKLKHRHSLLHDECLDAECERDSLKKDVNSLEKENERLKKENIKLKEDLEHCANQFTNDGKNVLLNLR